VLGNSSNLEVAETVIAIGNPFGLSDVSNSNGNLSIFIKSYIRKETNPFSWIMNQIILGTFSISI
jgi:S1-C subfamily serine protease